MLISYDIIKAIIRTEKSTQYGSDGKYLFLVNSAVNKHQIKKAVEEIYKVKVATVNTFILSGKLKRVRHQLGKTPDVKKAVVTLKSGQKIETL
jgi:large subunit ribosomal protein L23